MSDEARLEALLDRAERMGGRLKFDDLRELARLYRLSSARLAVLRSHRGDPAKVRYLNALCVRAYTHLRVQPPRGLRAQRFFLDDFPQTLAATARLQGLAAILLLAGALCGAALVSQSPAALHALVPASMYSAVRLEHLASSSAARAHFLAHTPYGLGIHSVFSAGLFVHNTQVGLLAFATGVLAGIPTLWLVFSNGLTLGAFAWIFSRDAAWLPFFAWLLPHAIPELLAVVLCASGGLLFAKAVVAPGREGAAAALRAAAPPALQLLCGAIPLFVIAALAESFVRQSSLSTTARCFAAAAALGAIAAYIWYVRRLAHARPRADLGWLVSPSTRAESQGSGSAPAR